ncbi:hypothetical protein TNCV_4096491 [Trichonephila clavipes]|nr:hypothetical protein TNCV_4096491 [Trichonephila clavipes]
MYIARYIISVTESDPNFLKSIATDDETWCFQYDPETKQQSAEWKSENPLSLESFYMWIEALSTTHTEQKNDLEIFAPPPLERVKTEGDLYRRCSVCNTRKDVHHSQ